MNMHVRSQVKADKSSLHCWQQFNRCHLPPCCQHHFLKALKQHMRMRMSNNYFRLAMCQSQIGAHMYIFYPEWTKLHLRAANSCSGKRESSNRCTSDIFQFRLCHGTKFIVSLNTPVLVASLWNSLSGSRNRHCWSYRSSCFHKVSNWESIASSKEAVMNLWYNLQLLTQNPTYLFLSQAGSDQRQVAN